MRSSGFAVFATLIVALTALPNALPAQVVETEEGPVEFLGLEHWTPERVRDTLAAVRPDVGLHSGACAAALRHEIGFPSAHVASYGSSFPGVPEGYTAIVLVEPEEADRVRYGEPPPDSLGPVEGWEDAYALFPAKRWAWMMAIQGIEDPPRLRRPLPDSTSFPAVRGFLAAHRTEEDRLRALAVLESDRNWINRSIAAAVLSGFPDHDETWWALVRAARGVGPRDYGTSEPIVALQTLAREERAIDWSPVAEDLRAILDGTSLDAFTSILTVLRRTSVSPDLAEPLLAGGGDLVLAHLRSVNPHLRVLARGFLAQVSGEDFGEDADRWAVWIDSLDGGTSDRISDRSWTPSRTRKGV